MEQKYWERFTETGRVEDYLYYKGMETCKNIMEQHEEHKSESVNNSYRDGTIGNGDWRI